MGLIWVNPGYDQKGFSKKELGEIAISVGALTLAFTIIYSRYVSFFSPNRVANTVCWFFASLIIVSFCFLFHEFGHKFVAQKYGAWAEYRMFPAGLIMSIVFSALGFLIAAPGAVYISGYIDRKQNGIISLAGPAVNLVMGGIFVGLLFVTSGRIHEIIYLLAHFSVFLAVFNLIPIAPLDGSKILAWNVPAYIATAACGIAMLILFYI